MNPTTWPVLKPLPQVVGDGYNRDEGGNQYGGSIAANDFNGREQDGAGANKPC